MIYNEQTSRNAVFVKPGHKAERLQCIPLMAASYNKD